MLNSPFTAEGARKLASRPGGGERADTGGAYSDSVSAGLSARTYSAGNPDGTAICGETEAQPSTPEPPEPSAWSYGYGAYHSTMKRVTAFHPLPHWTGEVWQGGAEHPDPKIGRVRLTANGGEPGKTLEQAAIRRWTAPRDMIIAITGKLKHEGKEGDGVQGRIVSSRAGDWACGRRRVRRLMPKSQG